MASSPVRRVTAAILSGALFLSSTAAAAAPVLPSAATISPWAALTAFGTQASRATLCSSSTAVAAGAAAAATAATQAAPARPGCVLPVVDAPPPPVVTTEVVPPPPLESGGFGVSPLLLGLGALALGGLVYLILNNDDDEDDDEVPISPA